MRQQRAAEEQQKKLNLVGRLREEATSPAYQTEIQDSKIPADAFSKGPESEVPAVTLLLLNRGRILPVFPNPTSARPRLPPLRSRRWERMRRFLLLPGRARNRKRE